MNLTAMLVNDPLWSSIHSALGELPQTIISVGRYLWCQPFASAIVRSDTTLSIIAFTARSMAEPSV